MRYQASGATLPESAVITARTNTAWEPARVKINATPDDAAENGSRGTAAVLATSPAARRGGFAMSASSQTQAARWSSSGRQRRWCVVSRAAVAAEDQRETDRAARWCAVEAVGHFLGISAFRSMSL